jgi:endonuclease V-like protein UPF0215 family
MIKSEIRVLGISFATFDSRRRIPAQAVGVVYRGNRWLEGALRRPISPEKLDSALETARLVTRSQHFPQLRALFLDESITKLEGGLDIQVLSKKTGLPVILVLRRNLKTLANLPHVKWALKQRSLLVFFVGLGGMDLRQLLRICASEDGFPEALRVARIIASSIERLPTKRRPRAATLRSRGRRDRSFRGRLPSQPLASIS